MNVNKTSLFWGLLLIGAGILALLNRLGMPEDIPALWMAYLAGISVLGLIAYGMSGWKSWGWLFPAGISGAFAVIIGLDMAGFHGSAVGSPIFIGLLLPFAAAYLIDQQKNWWALIPGGIMLFLTAATLLGDVSADEWIAALFLFMVAGAFLIVYLRDHKRVWALITAYAVGVVGIAPLSSIGGREAAWLGPVLIFAIALPFLYVYFRSPGRWWAIIPGGVLTLVAVLVTLDVTRVFDIERYDALSTAFLLGGIALIFSVIWLRHQREWAKFVALVLALVAAASYFSGRYTEEIVLPIAIILVGGYLLYTAVQPRKV